ncbi:MAG: TraI domain-containing protein [Gammaproteobacteria bacterium]|nr:TraI domain-containing protein [Gammaproteobacteria bacterium]
MLASLARKLFKPAAPTPTWTAAIPPLPLGVWPVLPADVLLEPHHKLLARIRSLAGVPADYWGRLYQPLLESFAAFVQQTPASEAHHHCGQGGMLTHSLQVMQLALEARKGKMLPPGAAAEEVNRQQHAWTFAIASAALLHDVGKPCSDQKLRLFNSHGQDTFAYWKPLDGALQAGCYRVEFVRNREYRTHELLPPLLARQLTPDTALSWLQQDFPNVFKAWLAYLSGQDETAGVLGQTVTEADRQSVADDLSGGQPIHTQQIPTAKAKPLSQRLLTGLRHLLDEQLLTLNRPGAAGFFDGDSLWLVSKRVLDELRTHLEKEGQTGIPSRNDRLMDELQQHGVLTPTPAGQAIWRATVKTGGMEQAFTLLRLPASALWADPALFPVVLEGSVTPEGEEETQPTPPPSPVGASHAGDAVEESLAGQAPTSGSPTSEPPATIEQEPSSPDKGAKRRVEAAGRPGGVSSDDPGQHFLHWLSEGLRSGKHKLNETGAFLHVVPEGLLLVSPRIFKEFAPDAWEHAQKRFTKLGLHRKAPNDSNIWLYQVRGQRKSGVVRGFLLDEPLGKLGLAYLPSPNKSLSLPEAT